MTTLILIEADEGSTASVYVANGDLDDLKETVRETINNEIEKVRERLGDDDEENTFYEQRMGAIIEMIDKNADWSPGRRRMNAVKPNWKEWTLVVCDGRYGDDY